MRPVAIIAAGKTPFGAFPDRDLRSLAVEAGEKCLKNGQVSPSQVEAFYLGNFAGPSFVGQNHLAPYISTAIGIYNVPSTRIEAACASGGRVPATETWNRLVPAAKITFVLSDENWGRSNRPYFCWVIRRRLAPSASIT